MRRRGHSDNRGGPMSRSSAPRNSYGCIDVMTQEQTGRILLKNQLEMEWRFAQDFVLGSIDEELAVWEPSSHVVTVHRDQQGWRADWPDEDERPIANPTIGWLLWHIEWWWSSTLSCMDGAGEVAPEDYRWSGGTDRIVELKHSWDEVLASRDLDELIRWFTPESRPFGFVASWVNFELAKNLSEINLLTMLHANRGAGVASS